MKLEWLSALLALSCATPSTAPSPFSPADPSDPGDLLDTGETEETDQREFALLEVVSTLVDDPTPWSSDVGSTQLYSWKRVEWERTALEVSWREEVCGMESTEVFGTVTSYPDAFVASIPVTERTATLSEATTGGAFIMEPHVTLLGARLDDPYEDPLPASSSDSEEWDQDGDGNPGVTVDVSQSLLGDGQVYVAQRSFTSYDGVIISASRVEGYLQSSNEQVVFGATTWWLELDTNSRDDPEQSHSWFIFQEIPGGTSCEGILAQRDDLF